MLQLARRGALSLGEVLPRVRAFTESRLEKGAGLDRDGRPDLYYTIFAIAALQAVDLPLPTAEVRSYLAGFGDGAGLDFVHLGALARCHGALGGAAPSLAAAILGRLEAFRSEDGGYEGEAGAAHGSAYGCFVALGAYQDLGVPLPEHLRMVQSLKFLETPDGAWGNAPGLPLGSTNATAAAVTLLHQLGMPVTPAAAHWLLGQLHPAGGFLAMPRAPIPDLLSSATSLHALACLEHPLPARAREACLDFLDTLWTIIWTWNTLFTGCSPSAT
jgi:hypothetical protein